MSYVLRTVAWQLILSDDGTVVNALQRIGVLGDDERLLATSTAVIAGITYNFLPFMALPLYVALEKIDRRLLEAATDLYASRATAFRKVTLPLALPGIFAGSLLTFIPACGDFINAALLGTPKQYMIGNVIQSKFLNILDYPTAAALSFTLMLFILVGIFLYARLLGRPEPDRGGDLDGGRRNRGAAGQRPRPAALQLAASRDRAAPLGARHLVGAGAAVPVHPGLHRRPVLVQRQPGPLQLHLGGLHAAPLAAPVRGPGSDEGADQLDRDRADLDRDRHRAGHVHGDGARALPLPRALDGRLLRLHAAVLARGRARRRAAGDVPDAEHQHRLRHDRDRPRDVHRVLRRGHGEGAIGGHGPPHRGGRRWTSARRNG